VVAAAGGAIEGRTAVQKLSYFSGEATGQDLGHRAHYYGPYSRAVEAALTNSAFSGDLEETMRSFASGRAFNYKLTEQGAEVVAELREEHAEAAREIDTTVQRLGELVPGYYQYPLSLAAKVDLILGQQGGTIEASAIPVMARNLGWEVSDEEVERAVEILVGLDRVTTSES
jgi:hypothetical protein